MPLLTELIEQTTDTEDTVVAILAPSNIDYVASIFALSRLGHAVLLLSNRLATEAYISLLQRTKCQYILGSSVTSKSIETIQAEYPLQCFPIPERHVYDIPTPSS